MPFQKSFSEQNHSSKSKQQQRSQWGKNKSFQGQQAPKINSKPLQEKPPVPVSTATKNKLNNFQFVGESNAEKNTKTVINLVSDDEKENGAIQSIASTKAFATMPGSPEEVLQGGPQLPELMSKDVPSTPGAKLALPDLIGMFDVRRAIHQISPDERIEWDHNKDLKTEPTPLSTITRAQKRARSSSPIGSSPTMASSHFKSRVQAQMDPGSELWSRYSLNSSNIFTPQGPSVPALAHIMQTSSPQPAKEGNTPRSASGFRRAISCGNQFPKRRRVGGHDGDDVFTEAAVIGPSKLSVLLERVQEGLTQPKVASSTREPSPIADLALDRSFGTISIGTEYNSPILERPQENANNMEIDQDTVPLVHAEIERLIPPQPPPRPSNSSDYGDFDDEELDASLLDVFDSNPEIATGELLHENEPALSNLPPQSSGPPSVTIQPQKAMKTKRSGPSPTKAIVDEFGDSDDDFFAADLEVLASQFDAASGDRAGNRNLERNSTDVPRKQSSKTESDDEFGDDGLDEFDFQAAEATATQAIQQTANSLLPSTQKGQAIQRYLVTNILESEFENEKGRKQKEKIILLQIESSKLTRVVHLRGVWVDTPITIKAFVHVIGVFDSTGRCVIDDENNLLILHPDHLISSTVVADSFGCTRRAVLQERVKATSDSSAPLVYGTILHEIFQAAMLSNRWDTEWLTQLIETVASRHVEDLYTIKIQVPQAIEYLQSKMNELQSWAELFVSSQPKLGAVVKASNGEKVSMCVSKLLDVEEHVWSPMYGLKGNIDATVQVIMQDGKKKRTLTVPFEVKTGKNPSAAHRAQTALYNLLLSDRYDIEIAYGILYYMETSETIRIPAIRRELIHMILQRNELACFVRERHAQLPPMLRKENMCNRCYAKVPCLIYHKLADDGTGETSGLKAKFDDVVKHLTPRHKEFFLKWDDLLTKEEKECLKFRRELWTMLSSEREKLGRCFANLIIKPGSAYEEQDNPKINRYRYTFVKPESQTGFSFLESQIIVGEPIVISDEKGHFALANGYVTHVRKNYVTVAVDRRLHNARIRQPGFDELDNQTFASIMEVAQEGATVEELEGKIHEEPMRYRLDKDEFSNGMATVRNNLIQIMADGPFGSRQIRGLVVDLNVPRFKTQATAYVLKDRGSLNVDQRRAIQKVMSAEDYALVLGMPGTGKTTTIAHIIRALVSQGKSVLLTSYTHSAVDNILLKLKDDHIGILRLGSPTKINPDVQEFATLAATTRESFEDIRSAWHDTPIVATTCLGINHAIFNERTFDYCIVDEASQITLPNCLGPIRLARTFILVGDHYQLPPLVQNEEARTGGLDISLFKHLSDTHPSSVVYLEHQYRMCEDVMALSNNLIYDGRLKCGSQEVAVSQISIPNMDGLKTHHFTPSTLSRSQKTICLGPTKGRCWIRDLLDPEIKVSFINTDPLLPLSREEAKGNRIVNPTEANICTQLVEALLSVGVPASSIGVMTHYRSQLALLKHSLRNQKDVEMHTADRFQGRDKEVVILSLVRSNEAKSIGELLKDWRRINVAFTRAKTKLLVIGSRETLKGNGPNKDDEEEMVARFVKLMESKEWVFDIPKGALEDHLFVEEGGTQLTASGISRPPGTQWKPAKPDPELEELGLNLGTGDKKRKVMSPLAGRENAARPGVARRQPVKKIFGNKPFKMPRMGVLQDVVNEELS